MSQREIDCPHCEQLLTVDPEVAATFQCPACHGILEVPAVTPEVQTQCPALTFFGITSIVLGAIEALLALAICITALIFRMLPLVIVIALPFGVWSYLQIVWGNGLLRRSERSRQCMLISGWISTFIFMALIIISAQAVELIYSLFLAIFPAYNLVMALMINSDRAIAACRKPEKSS